MKDRIFSRGKILIILTIITSILAYNSLASATNYNVKVKDIFIFDKLVYVTTQDGKVYAKGHNNLGKFGDMKSEGLKENFQLVEGLENVSKISASGHVLAVMEDGTIKAWGDNTRGQLGNSTIKSTVIGQTVINKDGTVFNNVKDAIAQGNVSVALTNDGKLYTWGSGSLGRQTSMENNVLNPELLNVFDDFYTEIHQSDGTFHAVTDKGELISWGANLYGEVGNGTKGTAVHKALKMKGEFGQGYLTGVKRYLVNQDMHRLAIMPDGKTLAWGKMLDDGMENSVGGFRYVPTEVKMSNMENTQVIDNYKLSYKDNGDLVFWGSTGSGRLTDKKLPKSTNDSKLRRPINMNTDNIVKIFHGFDYDYMFLNSNGEIWGNKNGAIIQYDVQTQTPEEKKQNLKIQNMRTGKILEFKRGYIAVKDNGTVWIWGQPNGKTEPTQLENIPKIEYVFPEDGKPSEMNMVDYDGNIHRLDAPYSDVSVRLNIDKVPEDIKEGTQLQKNIYVTKDGKVKVKGMTKFGIAGDGSNSGKDIKEFQEVPYLSNIEVANVHARERYTAIDKNGDLWLWGSNINSGLGINDEKISTVYYPVKSELTGVVKTVGTNTIKALTDDGEAYIWGLTFGGLDGLPKSETKTTTHRPEKPITTTVETLVGNGYPIMSKQDKFTYIAGSNSNYEYGNGTKDMNYGLNKMHGVPKVIDSSTTVNSTLLLGEDGNLYTSGTNEYGQTGHGTKEGYTVYYTKIENFNMKDNEVTNTPPSIQELKLTDESTKWYR